MELGKGDGKGNVPGREKWGMGKATAPVSAQSTQAHLGWLQVNLLLLHSYLGVKHFLIKKNRSGLPQKR